MTTPVRSRTRERAPEMNPVAPEGVPAKKGEIDSIMAKVSKTYGPHIMRRAADKPPFRHLRTHILTLDLALLGGIPDGLITCLVGWQSSGKSTTAMRLIGSAQRRYPDKKAVLIDTEGTYDPIWGAVHGIDNQNLILVQPPSGEIALDIAEAVIRAEETSIVVLDSLAQLVPVKEIEGAMEDSLVGAHARMINKFLRKATSALISLGNREDKPAVVVVQQWRSKMVIKGDPRVMPGGNGQLFAYAIIAELKNKENTDGTTEDGNNVVDFNDHSFTIKKNKIGNSLRNGEFLMVRNPDHPLGQGFIDDAKTAVTFGRRYNLITGGGSSWRMDGLDEKFTRLDDMAQYFYSDLEYFDQFKTRLVTEHRRKMGLIPDGWQ